MTYGHMTYHSLKHHSKLVSVYQVVKPKKLSMSIVELYILLNNQKLTFTYFFIFPRQRVVRNMQLPNAIRC
jgi:hypothetical protein